MPINDDDFETIEDTISDFDYFYDEEESFKRNRKIIFRYKCMSVGIVILMLFVLITVMGIVRMKMYHTNNVLTSDEIVRVEFKDTSEEIKEYASDFYITTIPDVISGVSLNADYGFLALKLNLTAIEENLKNYYKVLDGIVLPKDTKEIKYSNYCEELGNLIDMEKNFLTELQSEEYYASIYESSSIGDDSWANAILASIEAQVTLIGVLYPFQ